MSRIEKVEKVVRWAVFIVALAVPLALYIIFSQGTATNRAAIQAERNGENICEFAVAVSDAIATLVVDPTPEQTEAIAEMQRSARSCRPVAPEQ